MPINPGGGGQGGGGTQTGPRILADAGVLAGEIAQASAVLVQAPTAPAGGTQTPPTPSYIWTISGGRLTSDPTRQTVSFIADAPGTVTLNVIIITGTTSQGTSLAIPVLSASTAGLITGTARVVTNGAPIPVRVPAAQNGDRTFRWSVAGGTLASGQGTASATVRPGAPGLMEVSCDVTLQRIVTVPLRFLVVVTGNGPSTTLTINGGSGGGSHAAGSRVDVIAHPPAPGQVFDRWTGDTAVLGAGPLAATLPHAVITMPATPTTLTATYKPAPGWTPTTITGFNPIGGASGTTLTHHIPAGAQGVVFLLHDNGGAGPAWFSSPEQLLLARDLVAAGFGVASLSSVNRTLGTWSAQPGITANPDASTLVAAIDKLVGDGALAATQPIFLLGAGAGADAAVRYAQTLAVAGRPVRGAALYLSAGEESLAVTSRVPHFFALATHDALLGAVGNASAREHSQLLLGRGVPSAVVNNGAAPVYAARFRAFELNTPSFTHADAEAIWTALKDAALLDANNYPRFAPNAATVRSALPAAHQARAADVAAMLSAAYGGREFYSDANSRLIAFLNARVANAPAPAPGRLVNLSTRSRIAHLGDSFALGFTISGTQPATLLIRGIGPALARFGLAEALPAPRLEVNRGNTLIAANEGWGRAANAAQIASAAASVGAFALAPGALDAALLLSLEPGTYTATLRGLNGTSGDVLAEVYDVSKNGTRLTNLSTLARITSEGELVVPGIVLAGNNPRTLMVRAVGPGLSGFGLPADAVIGDPRIIILNAAGQAIAANNNWAQAGAPILTAAFPAVGAFPLSSPNDAALIDALPSGNYTLQAGPMPVAEPPPGSGTQTTIPRVTPNAIGSVLVEVYEVP